MSSARPASRPRVALIGVSGYARVHFQIMRDAQARGELALVAATVINLEQETETVAVLRAQGTRIYRTYEEMMRHEAGAIDLCVLPTGIQWHARMTIAALRAGMNVLVEKPLAGCLADVRAIRDAERATGRFVAVGFQDSYVPLTAWLQAQVCAGRIGRIEQVRVIGLWPRPAPYYERNRWAGCLTADGAIVRDSPMNNAFAHFVHLALFLAGSERQKSARATLRDAELFRAHAIESFDTSVVRATEPGGAQFWFGLSHACRELRDPELLIEGSAGRIEWQHMRQCVITTTDGHVERHQLPDPAATRQAMLRAVIARLQDPAVFISDTAMAEEHVALIEQIHVQPDIRTIPASQQEPCVIPDRGTVPAIRGLEPAFVAAHAQTSRLRDVGFVAESMHSP